MSGAINRAQFLRGDFSGKRAPLRPPWALEESQFIELCNRCGECVSACPEKILCATPRGFPQVNFSAGECKFCGNCVQQCSQGALRHRTSQPAWNYKAFINDACMALRNIVCVTCADQCEADAIVFIAKVGRSAAPKIDAALCNGCGACYRSCPARAIKISSVVRQSSNYQQRQLSVSEAT